MQQSESIAKLAEALALAQGEIEGAKKDSSNPFFKSSYADLASVWDACRKPLSKHGLSVVQSPAFIPEHPDMIAIDTRLCHSSGEWLEGRLVIKPVKTDPQSVGSCVTYMRRYSLQSLVGIAPEDDDGNAASGQGDTKKPAMKIGKKPDPPPVSPELPISTNAENDIPDENVIELISDAQRRRLFAITKQNGWPTDHLKAYLENEHGIMSTKEIPLGKYEKIIAYVESHTGYEKAA